ncbi:MAG: peptide deformylase [Lachnospiraceae bacterium]|nr:peptide deformylase [Lachnospiraceae bacterium]
MALRTIRTEEDEILRKKSKEVKAITERTSQLIDDMIETVHDAYGAGLAAVQVGILKRLCIVTVEPPEPEYDEEGNEIEMEIDPLTHNNGEDLVIINPEITVLDEEDTQCGTEGCLSFPGKFGYVTRPNHIRLNAFDRNLEPYELEAKGLLARAICHECDHMDGVLYVDKVENGEVYYVPDPDEVEDEDVDMLETADEE